MPDIDTKRLPALPKRLEDYPAIRRHAEKRQALLDAAGAARAEHERFLQERAHRKEQRVAKLVRVGSTGGSGQDDAGLDDAIEHAAEQVQAFEAAIRQVDLEGRRVQAEARAELSEQLTRTMRRLLHEMGTRLDDLDFEHLSGELEALRRYGLVSMPMVHVYLLDAITKWRHEAKTFNVDIEHQKGAR